MKEKEILQKAKDHIASISYSDQNRYAIWTPPYYGRLRSDIFDSFDFVVVWQSGEIWFVQVTTAHHIYDRRVKIRALFAKIGFAIPNSFIYGWNEKAGRFTIELVGNEL